MFRVLRFVLRWSVRAALLGLILLVALVVFRDVLLREYLVRRVQHVTGLESHLGSVETDTARSAVTLHDLRILDSPDFGGAPLLTLPELHLELDREALAYRELRLRLARVRIDELRVVRNQRGETNLLAVLAHANDRANAADAAVISPPGLVFTGVETLDLTFGTLHLVDLARPQNSRDLRIGITNEILREVKSTADFTPLLLRVMIRELGAGLRPGAKQPQPSERAPR